LYGIYFFKHFLLINVHRDVSSVCRWITIWFANYQDNGTYTEFTLDDNFLTWWWDNVWQGDFQSDMCIFVSNSITSAMMFVGLCIGSWYVLCDGTKVLVSDRKIFQWGSRLPVTAVTGKSWPGRIWNPQFIGKFQLLAPKYKPPYY
jgi:hypothetical protein